MQKEKKPEQARTDYRGMRTSSVLPVDPDLQLAVLVEGRAHLQRASGPLGQGGTQKGYLLLL